MTDLINEILATLRHNKLRTALTGFAVSWGIFLLITLLSMSHGIVNGMESMFSKRDNQTISISGGRPNKPYKGLSIDRKIKLRERDIDAIKDQNGSTVSRVAAVQRNDSAVISTSKNYISDGYYGIYPMELKSEGATIEQGRAINDNDLRLSRRVILLHKDNAKNLFDMENPIGQTVKMNGLSFTVIGVFSHEWETRSFIPFTTARNLARGSDEVRRITVGVDNLSTIEDGDKAENDLYVTLGRQHQFDPSDKSALWVWNKFKQHLTQSTAMGAIGLAVWIIGLLTMLSGIVGVSNIMFVSVRERTHEIGVRRAIGARPISIIKQIILESVAITTLFGYIGVIMGVCAAHLIEIIAAQSEIEFIKDPSVDISVAIQVTIVLIMAGATAGLFPALKSLKIKPVEALRDE